VNETIITIEGNLTADPELRFTPAGAAVANFTIASTPRTFDKNANEWVDGQALFLNCSAWRNLAENVTESLSRGSRVIARGKLKQRSFETKSGEKRTVIELEVENIGPSLISAVAKVEKTTGTAPRSNAKPRTPAPAAEDSDPWGSAPSFGSEETEPPF
jgi:single-strand DNA-binding protein